MSAAAPRAAPPAATKRGPEVAWKPLESSKLRKTMDLRKLQVKAGMTSMLEEMDLRDQKELVRQRKVD